MVFKYKIVFKNCGQMHVLSHHPCVWETHQRERQDRGYAFLVREIRESKLLRLATRN